LWCNPLLTKKQPQAIEQLSQLLISIAYVYTRGEGWLNYSYFKQNISTESKKEIMS